MPPKHPLTQTTLSWAAIALGFTIGLLGLFLFGQSLVYLHPSDTIWRLGAAGCGLAAALFLIGSSTALRNPKRAGLIFFCGGPIAAFALTYPGAERLIRNPDGSSVVESPLLSTALILTFIFYIPFVAPLFAIRNRKRALYTFLIAASLAVLVFAKSQWTSALVPPLALWSVVFSGFGGFWWGTHKLGWLPLSSRPRSLPKRVAIIAFQCILVLALDLLGTFAWAAIRSSLFTGNCSGSPLFVKPMSPNHVVFTARLIRVGHKVKVGGRWAGDWGIGVVQESFWGLPPLTPHLVFIENQLSWEGETYFISGLREYGLLTHQMPIVDAQRCGWRFSLPAANAKIFLRLLRNPPPADQYRIMGYVRAQDPPENERRVDPTRRTEQDKYESVLDGMRRVIHLPKVNVRVTSATWNSVVTTDEDGIYDIVGVPPDNYTLRVLDPPPNQVPLDRLVRKEEMLGMVRLGLDLHTVWDGSIEGTVKDVSGKPAQAFIVLQNPD